MTVSNFAESDEMRLPQRAVSFAAFLLLAFIFCIAVRPTIGESGLFVWQPETAFAALSFILFGWWTAPVVLLGLAIESWNTPHLGLNPGFILTETLLNLSTAAIVATSAKYLRPEGQKWGSQGAVLYFVVASVGASLLAALSPWMFLRMTEGSQSFVLGWLSTCTPIIALVPVAMVIRSWVKTEPRPDFFKYIHRGNDGMLVTAQYATLFLLTGYVVIARQAAGALDVFPIFAPVFWFALTAGLEGAAVSVFLVELLLVLGSTLMKPDLGAFTNSQIATLITSLTGLIAGALVTSRRAVEDKLRNQGESLRRQLAEAQVIRRLTDSIIALNHESALFELGAESIGQQLAPDEVIILRIDLASGGAETLSSWRLNARCESKLQKTLPQSEFQPMWARLEESRTTLLSSADSPSKLLTNHNLDVALHGGLGLQSLMIQPFAFDPGGFYAAFISTNDRPRLWLSEDAEFAGAICDQITLALQKMKLLNEREERTRSFNQMSQAIVANTGDAFFVNLILRLADATGAPVAYLIKLEDDGETALPMALLEFGTLRQLGKFKVQGTPTAAVVQEGSIALHDGALERFPRMAEVFGYHPRGFAGIRLNDVSGSTLGTLCVVSDQVFEDPEHVVSVLRIFATRVAAEIERELREKALRASESSYRRLLETAREGIIFTDANGRISYANAEVASLIGCAPEELIGTDLSSHFETPSEHPELASDSTITRLHQVDLELRRRDGSTIWTMVAFSPILDDLDKFEGRLAMITDISERKRAEQDLEERVRERTAELTAANQELESFCYSISHDLRQPLRAIDGFSRAVIEDSGDSLAEESQQHLERVRKAARRMSDLIDALLRLSRLSRMEMNRERVDLSTMAEGLLSEMKATEPNSVHTFSVRRGMNCKGDPKLLHIVLENLIGNAWKFSSKSEAPFIEVGYGKHGGKNAFYVRDNGIGFDMSYESKLFKPFERLHSDTEFYGTGIGLATVARVIKRHGGEIWAHSEPQKGACFFFTLP